MIESKLICIFSSKKRLKMNRNLSPRTVLRSVIACLFLTVFVFVLSCRKQEKTFTLLDPDDTGIHFSNRISENDTMNILSFEYVYNGGGVALGDVNNDSLVDVYFSGNMVDNKLYLNKGDFHFEDVTDKANVAAQDKWSSGVAMVDVNADGKLDIYVCNNVKKGASQRENQLYINQGNDKDHVPVFKEMARAYGLADTTHTTNAAFFDYDNDGDLDVFLVVNEMDDTYYPNKFHEKVKDGSSKRTDRLYRNDWDTAKGHPVFTNVSREAGILIEGYGLGVNVTDINQDGWKDIYVTNDYITNDLLYINNGDGTFTDRADQYFGHTSYSAMGNDVADINNDGLPDVIALDMMPATNRRKKMMTPANSYITYQNNEKFGYQFQVARNTLQLNQGKLNGTHPVFGEIGLLSGIAETDWSWTPMVTDFDNDGYRDLIVTNGFPKDITDMDFMVYRASVERIMARDMLLDKVPSVKISNFAFKNRGDLKFEDVTAEWGIDLPGFSNGAAYADLDNDGDLDYIVNNINDSAFVYRNNSTVLHPMESHYLRVGFAGEGKNLLGLGATVEITYDRGKKQYTENTPYRGYLSSVEPALHFGLGRAERIETLRVTWPGGKSQVIKNILANRTIVLAEKDAVSGTQTGQEEPKLFAGIQGLLPAPFVHEEEDIIDFNTQKLLPHKLSQYGPAIAVGDVNGDGLEDVFVGGAMGRRGTFLILGKNGKFTTATNRLPGVDGLAKNTEDMGVLLFDADGDNDLDLYIVSGSYEAAGADQLQDKFYTNDGKGYFTEQKDALPKFLKSGSCVKAVDYDRDGDLDLFVGGRVEPGHYPKPVSSYLLRNDSDKAGSARFTDVTGQIAPELASIGLICDGLWTDVDNDGWMDLLVAGEWMPVTLLKNKAGKLAKVTTGLEGYAGLWSSLVAGDFDNDGDMDYVAGNVGMNNFGRATNERPARIYAADFNKDGYFDAIPTVYFRADDGSHKEFPLNNRDELGKQIITVRQRFQEYAKFAQAGMTDIFKPEELKDALVYSVNQMYSAYIENKGNGQFSLHELPVMAQVGPVFGMTVGDYDQDGNLDVLLAGNDYGADLLTGRLDAFHGLLLKGDGKGRFVTQTPGQSGFGFDGNAKALVQMPYGTNQSLILTSQNRGVLKMHVAQSKGRYVAVRPTETSAVMTYSNGRKRKEEPAYGSSFLSQSTRMLFLPAHVKNVTLTDSKGVKRTL